MTRNARTQHKRTSELEKNNNNSNQIGQEITTKRTTKMTIRQKQKFEQERQTNVEDNKGYNGASREAQQYQYVKI